MLTKESKKVLVSKLESVISKSKSVVFTNFHGLTVMDGSILRKALKEEGVVFGVAKKTLIKRALDGAKIEGERPKLKGELALAYLSAQSGMEEDALAPARGVYEFQKKLSGKVSILGGIFEGKYMDANQMIEIASIPSLQVLRGMFVNIINSPIQRIVVALSQKSDSQ